MAPVPASSQLAALGAQALYVSRARAIENDQTALRTYLRKPALAGMVRLFQLAADHGLPMEVEPTTIIDFLDDLDERSTGAVYWLRNANAMQEVAREMRFPYQIVDGFEVRVGPGAEADS